jgi:hypothetical protein
MAEALRRSNPARRRSDRRSEEAEHATIDPLLAEVDGCYSLKDHRKLAVRLGGLAAALSAHMAHEEQDALPLIEKLIGKRIGMPLPDTWAKHKA